MKRIIITLFFISIGFVNTVLAQNLRVVGIVTATDTGETIPGAGVIEVGTTNGTVTDLDGVYRINCPSNCTLNFSALGFLPQNVAVQGRPVINVALSPDPDWQTRINSDKKLQLNKVHR